MIARLVLTSLAVWRLASLLYVEHWLDPLRALFGIRYDPQTGENTYPANWIGDTFSCFWCLTMLVCPIALLWPVSLTERLMLCLASSSGAILIELWIKRRVSRR